MRSLLSDIGGTHIRFAIDDGGDSLQSTQKLPAAEFDSFEGAVQSYLKACGVAKIDSIRAATAAWPNENGVYEFSNASGWDFNPEALREKGYNIGRIYNDFEASSYGALSIPEHERKTLRDGRRERSYPRIVCGPGTGLGLSYALPLDNGGWRVQACFGAHLQPAGLSADQYHVIIKAQELSEYNDGVKAEHLASGRGLPLLHAAVCAHHDLPAIDGDATQLLDQAREASVQKTLQYFHAFLGVFIHNSIVSTHGYGGVYLNGGMLDRLMERDLFDFKTLEAHVLSPIIGYVDHILKATPIYYVSDPYLALKGLKEATKYE